MDPAFEHGWTKGLGRKRFLVWFSPSPAFAFLSAGFVLRQALPSDVKIPVSSSRLSLTLGDSRKRMHSRLLTSLPTARDDFGGSGSWGHLSLSPSGRGRLSPDRARSHDLTEGGGAGAEGRFHPSTLGRGCALPQEGQVS